MKEIIRMCARHRQTMLFSATMTDEVPQAPSVEEGRREEKGWLSSGEGDENPLAPPGRAALEQQGRPRSCRFWSSSLWGALSLGRAEWGRAEELPSPFGRSRIWLRFL